MWIFYGNHMKMITCLAEGRPVHAGGHAAHCAFLVAHHLLYHLAHLVKLAHQGVYILHGYARARGNALAAAGVEDIGMAALLRGHAAHDCLGLFKSVFVDLNVLELAANAGKHAQDVGQRAHLLHLLHLL